MTENLPSGTVSMDLSQGVNYMQETLDKFIGTAGVETVYARPIKQGENVIIPTAEVMCALGFGMGMGEGTGPQQGQAKATPQPGEGEQTASGSGVGGGGGGYTFSRPVALIVANENEVTVVPVIDRTKIMLAAFTTFGFMVATLMRFTRGSR